MAKQKEILTSVKGREGTFLFDKENKGFVQIEPIKVTPSDVMALSPIKFFTNQKTAR